MCIRDRTFNGNGAPGNGGLVVETRRAVDGSEPDPSEIGIRPEHIAITDPSDRRAQLKGIVLLVERLGNLTIVYVDTPAGQLVAEGNGEIQVSADENVGLVFEPSRTHLFGRDGRVI